MYFLAFDTGFAPIKSLIEHALSLEAEAMCLHWTGSVPASIYLPNIAHAWKDALDNFYYEEHVAGFDLRAVNEKRAQALRDMLDGICISDPGLLEGDLYIAGPEAAVCVVEQYFIDHGLPKTRVSVAGVR